jgi:hypothetical protein
MTIVDADGTFATNGDLPGRYYLNVVIPPGWTLASVTQAGRSVADDVLELASEDVNDVVLTMRNKIANLTGTITDRNGAQDPQSNVVLFPADTDSWRRGEYNPRRVRLVMASGAGTYAINDVPAGDYYIIAIGDGAASRWAAPRFLDEIVSHASRTTIREGENSTLTLRTSLVK